MVSAGTDLIKQIISPIIRITALHENILTCNYYHDTLFLCILLKEGRMKKYYIRFRDLLKIISFFLLIFVVFSVLSCTTSGVLGIGDPLATSSYVDNSAAEYEKHIADLEAELQQLYDDISILRSDIDAVSNIKADLDEMPREMLRQLVEALQSYLEMLENEG